jgi:UDP-N-acetylglucosamine 4-epimerase
VGQVYNVALGGRLSLNAVFESLRCLLEQRHPELRVAPPVHEDFRPGDIRHSQAEIGKARRLLGYEPMHDVHAGLEEALPWYEARLRRRGDRTAEMQRVDDVT